LNNAGFSLFKDNLIIDHPFIKPRGYWTDYFFGIGYQVILEMYLWVHDRLLRKPGELYFSLNFKVATSSTLVLLIAGTVAFSL